MDYRYGSITVFHVEYHFVCGMGYETYLDHYLEPNQSDDRYDGAR